MNILIDQALNYLRWIQIVIILHSQEIALKSLSNPETKEEYATNKYDFLPSESKELHPTFRVDGVRFT
jgi:hypothetical protein